ncbi:hypothetical protein JCM3766R1_001861 [Sporobolomyces carnicolor]
MSISQYTFSSPFFSYACPPQTPTAAAWKTLDLAPEIDGETGGGTKIEVKGTRGLGCTVSLAGWKGSEAWIQGWLNYTCHSAKGKNGFESTFLCSFGGLDPAKEHTLTIMNSPGGDSRLIVSGATSNGREQDEIKISDFVTVATTAKPPSINLDDFYASTSTSTSSSSTSAANLTSSTSETRSGTTASSSTSATPTESNHVEPDSSAAITDSTLTFVAVSFGILVVVVGVIVAVMWNRSKPTASGENLEESALLKLRIPELPPPPAKVSPRLRITFGSKTDKVRRLAAEDHFVPS